MSAQLKQQQSTSLELRELSVGIDGKVLIKNFNLTVGSGEIVGLLGPSGYGKTTLLRTISGLIDPLGGQVLLNGLEPENRDMPAFRRKVLYVNQLPVMLNMTVRDNIVHPFNYGTTTADLPKEAELCSLCDRLMLDRDILNQNAKQLSVGQMQRVSLIRAILVRPVVMLLDEPTGSLDEHTAHAVESLICDEVSSSGMAVLFVTHDKALARKICNRIIDISLAEGVS